jgi:AraC-like DNA-binding protein
MPRAARFTISVIEDLFRQLEYAPPETRHRQMDAAERLIGDIDLQQIYPEEFIIFRITGYRPESSAEPTVLVGRALVGDLANLVLQLSRTLSLSTHGDTRRALTMDDAAKRLHVSTKTLQRYRRQGLVCHAVMFDDGVQRVACFEDALERFVDQHEARVNHAAGFSRVDRHVEDAIIENARYLRLRKRLTLNEASQRLAKQHGRAHETVRQMLRRHDRAAEHPIFADGGPLDERAVKVMYRAWRWGIEPADLARRFGKSKATVHRSINRRRAELIKRVDVAHVHLKTFDRPDAAEVILSPQIVRTAAENPWPTRDALEIVASDRDMAPLERSDEEALLAAQNFLMMQIAADVMHLELSPNSDDLDAIETNLRWVGALRLALVWQAMPSAVRRIEQNVGRPISQLARDEVVRLTQLAMRIATRALAGLDTSRGGRLERAVGFAMDKELAKNPLHIVPGRATARHSSSPRPTLDPQREVVPWHWLLPPMSWRDRLKTLEDVERQAIELRYGWSGQPPMVSGSVASTLSVSPIQIVRILRAAQVKLRRHIAD